MKEKNAIEKLLELPEEKLDKIIEKLSTNKANKLMWELEELLFEKLPEKCRIEKLEQYVTLTKYKIEWNNKHSKCCGCVCGKNIQERDKEW